jgi:hypothetical protein
MVASSTGFFAKFDLQDADSCRLLATALDYWLSGGRDKNSAELRDLSGRRSESNTCPNQQSTFSMIVQRMGRSTLLTAIINEFLQAPRTDDCIVVAAMQMDAYAQPEALNPGGPDYAKAQHAWETRKPLGLPSNYRPDLREPVDAAMVEAHYDGYVRQQGYVPYGELNNSTTDDTVREAFYLSILSSDIPIYLMLERLTRGHFIHLEADN